MEILHINYEHIRKNNEYIFLRDYVLKNNLMTQEALINKEIDILLYEVDENKLKRYFKWLFSKNIFEKKRVFIKEVISILNEDLIQHIDIADYFDIEIINQCAKQHNLTIGNTEFYSEVILYEMSRIGENNFQKRFKIFAKHCLNMDQRSDEDVDILFDLLVKMLPRITQEIPFSKKDEEKINKFKVILKTMKLTTENYNDLIIKNFKKFVGKKPKKGGAFIVTPKMPHDIDYNPLSIYNFSPEPETVDLNLTKLDLEDLKELMKIYEYPRYQHHIEFLKEIIMKEGREDIIKNMGNKILQVNLIGQEKYYWGRLINEIKLTGCRNMISEFLYNMLIFNEINEPVFTAFTNKKRELCQLIKLKKSTSFQSKYMEYLNNMILESVFSDFYNAFIVENRLNFRVKKLDTKFEEEYKELLNALVGFDKQGTWIDLRSKRKSRGRYYKINLLVLLKSNERGEEVAKYIKPEDFINYFQYLYNIRDVMVNVWGKLGGEKKLKKIKRRVKKINGYSLFKKERIPQITKYKGAKLFEKVAMEWGKLKNEEKEKYHKKARDLNKPEPILKGPKFENFESQKLARYYNNFYQSQIFHIMRPFIDTLIEIINIDRNDTYKKDEVKDMINKGKYLYKVRTKEDVRIEIKDYLEDVLIELKSNKYEKEFKNYLLNQILTFITEFSILIEGKEEETKYLDLFLLDELNFGNLRLNRLPIYINIMKDMDLNQDHKIKLQKIITINKRIVQEKLSIGVQRNIKKVMKYGNFSENDQKKIRFYAKKIVEDIDGYRRDINQQLKEIKKSKQDKSEQGKLLRDGLKKENVFDYIKLLLDTYYQLPEKQKKTIINNKVVIKKPTLQEILNKVDIYQEYVKEPSSLKEAKTEIYKTLKLKSLLKRIAKEDEKINSMFKKREDKIEDPTRDLEMYVQKEKEMKEGYFSNMKRKGNKILDEFEKKYKLINNNKRKEIGRMMTKMLIHQKDFLHIVHKDIKNLMINYGETVKNMMVSNVDYEYMLIVVILLSIIKGLDVKKIDKIDLLESENLLNLKGYDKERNRFVTILKVNKGGEIIVKEGTREYTSKKENLIIGDYLRVRVTGGQYKGEVAKLMDITGLSLDEWNRLSNLLDIKNQELKAINNREYQQQIKKDIPNHIKYIKLLRDSLELETRDIIKQLHQKDMGKVLMYEGLINRKIMRISLDDLEIIEGQQLDLKNKKEHKTMRLSDEKWGESIFSYVYKTYNNLMTDTRNPLGLVYFRKLYIKAVKQINTYLKKMNTDISNKSKIVKQIQRGKLKLKGKLGPGEKQEIRLEIRKLKAMEKEYKLNIEDTSAIMDKKYLKELSKYYDDIKIDKKFVYLKMNNKVFQKIQKEIGKLEKTDDQKFQDYKIELNEKNKKKLTPKYLKKLADKVIKKDDKFIYLILTKQEYNEEREKLGDILKPYSKSKMDILVNIQEKVIKSLKSFNKQLNSLNLLEENILEIV